MAKGVFVGLATIDLVYTGDEFPAPNAKVVARSQQVFAGGPATNAAVTFSHLGGEAVLVASIGRHPLAASARQELANYSVQIVDLIPTSDQLPPISSIFVDRNGRRTVVSVNTTQTEMPPPIIHPAVLGNADVVLVDGHAMEACHAWAAAARARGIRTVFDGGSWKSGTEQLLKNVDTAICSADFLPPGCANAESVIEYLVNSGVNEMAITRGADPIRFMCRTAAGSIDVPQVDAVDTMGAGDVFHGAFCYFAASGSSFENALRNAAPVAAESCRSHGPRQWMHSA